ncbi:MAG: hypothetical protein NW224_06365 [Leptolyngbyaceae cyanobacterium bins.302]|nr:hypothetical protein [Leptolyngbyaceae cyanobacterium bins.302]
MAKIFIPSKELITTLNISDQELIAIAKFFDSIPDDEWELVEGKDYRVVAKNGLREYTESGAYTIARYLEETRTVKDGFWARLQEWIFHTRENIRKSFVKKKILENSSSLLRRRDQFWISRADAIAVFGTRSDYLTKMADHTQKTTFPLIKGEDFDEFIDEGGLYFSLTGIRKLSFAFSEWALVPVDRSIESIDE